MAAPTIYYMRHGETDWNVDGRLQGSLDIPLNELGRRQAVHAGNILTDLLARERRDPATLGFVSSPLVRARSTMELARGQLALPPDGYALDDRLREIGYGRWEGFTLPQMQLAEPALFAQRLAAKWTVPAPGGESYVQVQARMQQWYESLTADTVAVSHGGSARALMVVLGNETPASAESLSIEQGAVYVFSGGGLSKYS